MFRAPCTSPRSLALLSLCVPLAACSSGGGGVTGSAGPVGPTATPLAVAFQMRIDQGVGKSAGGLFADMDLDGDQDLLTLDPEGVRARVAQGQGDGSFVVVADLAAPQAPVAAVTSDLDGDGLLDIALGCGSPLLPAQAGAPFALALWLQQPGGVFDPAPTSVIALPEAPIDLCARPTPVGTELAVVLPLSSRLQRFALTGLALGPVGELKLEQELLLSITSIDVGQDGMFDLVVGELDEVLLLEDDGLGGLAPAQSLIAGLAGAISIEAADLDGDGLDELAVSEVFAPRVQLFDHDASGLSAFGALALDGESLSILLEDLDGDGVRDLCAALSRHSALQVFQGDGALGFAQSGVWEAGSLVRALGAETLAGDSAASVYALHLADLALLRPDGEGGLSSMRGTPLGELPYFLVCEDLDKDGLTDALSVDVLQRSVVFLRGQTGGGLEKVGEVALVPSADAVPTSLVVRDFDGDGFLDLAAPVHQSGEVVLLRNQGSLPFAEPAPADRHPAGPLPLGLDSTDVDGDGFDDLIVASGGDQRLRILAGSAGGDFALAGEVQLPARPVAVIARDLDLDGDIDLAVSTAAPDGSDTRLLILEGDGTLEPSLLSDQALPAIAPFLAAGDLDGDGQPELALAQAGLEHQQLIVARSAGGLQFDLFAHTVGKGPGYVSLRDVDTDGTLELLVALAAGEFVLLEDDGAGGLVPVATASNGARWPLPFGASAVELCEATGDELLDLVAVSPDSRYLWVSESHSAPLPTP